MAKQSDLKYSQLRIKWFRLKTKEFIRRYSAGLLVIFLFLPGVAVGDNLIIFLSAVVKPLLIVSSLDASIVAQFSWAFALLIIFNVWAVVQKEAIDGGQFNRYLKSVNLNPSKVTRIDCLMILIANHFLWVFIVFGFIHLLTTDPIPAYQFFRYILLIVLLITAQYVSVFNKPNCKREKLSTLIFLMLSLTIPFPETAEWLRLSFIIAVMSYSLYFRSNNLSPEGRLNLNINSTSSLILKPNLSFQMLFKAAPSSTWFRIVFMSLLIVGFASAGDHLKAINDGSLTPHAFVIEATLAYFLSGLYLIFRDQRLSFKNMLTPLPIPNNFWFFRDVLSVLIISLIIHTPYFLVLGNQINTLTLIQASCLHLLLLIVIYPLRMFAKDPTFSGFIVTLVLTVIFIYNFT